MRIQDPPARNEGFWQRRLGVGVGVELYGFSSRLDTENYVFSVMAVE